MNIKDIKPAGTFAQQFGVKILAYGPPGVGKTPLVNTASNPLLLITEPGTLSLRGSTVQAFEAYTPKLITEFFDWFFNSTESKGFDTLAIDSISQLSEIILKEELARNRDGRMAYGKMSERVMNIVSPLYFMRDKHIYMIAKMDVLDENGGNRRRPYFPGKDLNVKIPHLFDEIIHIGKESIPGYPQAFTAFRCQESFSILARDRSGKLSELEEPHLAKLIAKITA